MSDLQDPAGISDELAARLSTCAGFGARGFRGRRKIDETHVPCWVLVEGSDRPASQSMGRVPLVKTTGDYAVHIYVACDADHPNLAAREARRVALRALFGTDVTLGGRCERLVYEGSDIAPRADGASHVLVAIALSAAYVEDLTK